MARKNNTLCVEVEVNVADLDLNEVFEAMIEEHSTTEVVEALMDAWEPDVDAMLSCAIEHGGVEGTDIVQSLMDNDVIDSDSLLNVMQEFGDQPNGDSMADYLASQFDRDEIIEITRLALKAVKKNG